MLEEGRERSEPREPDPVCSSFHRLSLALARSARASYFLNIGRGCASQESRESLTGLYWLSPAFTGFHRLSLALARYARASYFLNIGRGCASEASQESLIQGVSSHTGVQEALRSQVMDASPGTMVPEDASITVVPLNILAQEAL